MDWRDTERKDRLVFEMIDPMDATLSRGIFEGVIESGSGHAEGYYTDTRISATLEVADSNYIENSRIRIHHYVDEWDYHNVIGTFFVLPGDLSYEHGQWSGKMDLRSSLYGLQVDSWAKHYVVPAGAYTKATLTAIFNTCMRPFRILSSVSDVRYANSKVWEFGSQILSQVYDICDKCSARLGVDGMGVVTVEPYINPKNLTPVFEYDYDASDSMIVGEVTKSDNSAELPGRVGIMHKSGDTEIIASATVATTSPASPGRRGYMKASSHNLSDMSPATYAQALQLAQTKLREESELTQEWEFTSLYIPLHQGDAVNFTIDGHKYKCLVKNVEPTYEPGMNMKIRLKAVA